MHGADQKCQGIKSPPLSSPQSMTGENCCIHSTSFAPGLPGFSGGTELQLPKKWLEASLPFMSPLLMSYQCFLGLLPQQTTYTWFLVSGTAYGGTWTKIVSLQNMLVTFPSLQLLPTKESVLLFPLLCGADADVPLAEVDTHLCGRVYGEIAAGITSFGMKRENAMDSFKTQQESHKADSPSIVRCREY